jgi:hypothetical protein
MPEDSFTIAKGYISDNGKVVNTISNAGRVLMMAQCKEDEKYELIVAAREKAHRCGE